MTNGYWKIRKLRLFQYEACPTRLRKVWVWGKHVRSGFCRCLSIYSPSCLHSCKTSPPPTCLAFLSFPLRFCAKKMKLFSTYLCKKSGSEPCSDSGSWICSPMGRLFSRSTVEVSCGVGKGPGVWIIVSVLFSHVLSRLSSAKFQLKSQTIRHRTNFGGSYNRFEKHNSTVRLPSYLFRFTILFFK